MNNFPISSKALRVSAATLKANPKERIAKAI
jgi:hypothetical protein